MSAFIRGKDLLVSLKISGSEFIRGCVFKGLIPYSDHGLPYRPAEIVNDVIAGLEQELGQHDELAWNLIGTEREDYITNRIQPLHECIQIYRACLEGNQDVTWAELGLWHDNGLADSFVERLLNCLYLKAEIVHFSPWPAKFAEKQELASIGAETASSRHNQACQLKCRNIARRLWQQDPLLTIADMIKQPEILENSKKLNGKPYSGKTVRDWIKNLCPDRSPGRRPFKKHRHVSMAC